MRSIVDGHTYELENSDGTVQPLQFIHKEIKDDGALEVVAEGTTNEEVLEVMIARLTCLHENLPDLYTKNALGDLQHALEQLQARNSDRERRGVKGTNNA